MSKRKKNKSKVLVIDVDGTICYTKNGSEYSELKPRQDIIEKIIEYKKAGFYIIISTSRNMNTFDNNIGLINMHTAPVVLEWLNKYSIPFDEIHYGKPWCGFDGFYIDDKTIRPSEFLKLSRKEIKNLLEKELNH
jgi:capsule biosynthesis phosphatase